MSAVRKLRVVGATVLVLTLAACTSSTDPAAQIEAHVHVTPTAVTGAAGDFWLLGEYPCPSGTCPVVMRSANGGNSFVRVGSPPASVVYLDFVNREDGYAWGDKGPSTGTPLYWTANGGAAWHLALAHFRWYPAATIALTNKRAYALVTKDCVSNSPCTSLELASSSVTSNVWTISQLPPAVDEQVKNDAFVTLAAFGSKVWLVVVGVNGKALLFVSPSDGRSFASLPSTGLEGIACNTTATSASTMWGFCGTGNFGYAARSSNGGRHFVTLGPVSTNGGSVAPVSNDEAIFLDATTTTNLLLTRDGGAHFRPVRFSSLWESPSYGATAYANPTTWLVLGAQGPAEPKLKWRTVMWRTSDGGRSWQRVNTPMLETGR